MKKAYLIEDKSGYEKLGLTDTIQMWEDGLRTTGKKGEFEWWYFDSKLNDGSTLVITFFTTNLTNTKGGFNPNIKIELTNPNGLDISDKLSFKEEECFFSKEKCEVKMQENYFKGDLNEYQIYVKTNKFEASIKLTKNVNSWRPKTGFQQYGDDSYFAWLPSVPEGNVEATITINGVTKKYQGTGYHDHNWGNKSMLSLLHHWYWGRAKIGPYTIISAYMTTTKKYGYKHLPIFMLANGKKLITDNLNNLKYFQNEPKYDPNTKKTYHQKIIFEYKGDEGNYIITYQVKEIIGSFSLLQEDNNKKPKKFLKMLLSVIGLDPTYNRFNGIATIEKIENNQVVEKHQSNATWELMYFSKNKDI